MHAALQPFLLQMTPGCRGKQRNNNLVTFFPAEELSAPYFLHCSGFVRMSANIMKGRRTLNPPNEVTSCEGATLAQIYIFAVRQLEKKKRGSGFFIMSFSTYCY